MLFRKQVLANQQQRLHGNISLAQPMRLSIFIMAFCGAIAILAMFSLTFDYARKETVSGYLKPDMGLINVYNHRSAVLKHLYIKEGQQVEAGEIVAMMQLNRGLSDGSELSEHQLSELQHQLKTLEKELQFTQQLGEQRISDLTQQINDEKNVVANLKRQHSIAKKDVALQSAELKQLNTLRNKQFLSDSRLRQQERLLLDAQQEAESIAVQIETRHSSIRRWQREQESQPWQNQLSLAAINKQISATRLKISEAQSQYQYVIKAEQSGTVTGVTVEEGQFINNNSRLMTIIPQQSVLVAELLIPSRSVGLIEEGDEVRLRFDAFPYQRFGFMPAHVISIDRSITDANHPSLPIKSGEPVYRVRAKIESQRFITDDQELLLKSGMMLQADVILERRSIAGWLFNPLLSLSGRVG